MSQPVSPQASPLELADRYGDTLLKFLIALVVLAKLGLLSMGLWLYFHPSFF